MSDTDPYAGPVVEEAQAVEPVVVPVDVPEVVVEKEVVPEGPAKEVLAWVGTDSTRAALALEAEKSGQKRSTLITKLNAVIEA